MRKYVCKNCRWWETDRKEGDYCECNLKSTDEIVFTLKDSSCKGWKRKVELSPKRKE